MMTTEEIHNRIAKPIDQCSPEEIEHDQTYYGIDMRGFTDDNARRETAHLCKQKNYRLIKESFPEELSELTIDNFWLQTWKGGVYWVEPQKNWGLALDKIIHDMSGWETWQIINWILTNKQHWHPSNKKNVQPENSIEKEHIKTEQTICRNITKQQRYEVLKRQKWCCNICNKRLKYGQNSGWEGEVAHIDHVHPYTQRNTYINGEDKINEDQNLQGLCPGCNLKKSGKMIN